MAEKKGAIVIDTKMNYSKIQNDFKNIEKKTQSLINKYNKSVDSIKSQELAITKLKNKLSDIESGSKEPESVKLLKKSLELVNKELDNCQNKLAELDPKKTELNNEIDMQKSLGGLANQDAIKSAELELQKLNEETELWGSKFEKAEIEANKLNEELSRLTTNSKEAQELKTQIEILNSKLSQTKTEATQTANEINEVFNQKSFNLGGIQSGINEVNNKIDKFKNRVTRLISTVAIFGLLRSHLTSLRNGFISLLETDDAFSSSLNQIKANLMTAFAPIYNACLPAINSLMNALSRLTGTIAVFVSGLFGQSLDDAKSQAKGLSKALDKTSKSGEKASGSLASFDKLEVISDNTGGGSDDSNSSGAVIDYSGETQSSSKLLDFLNKIKESLSGIDFTNLNNALGILKDKLSDFGDIVGGALWWVWENILVPLAKWTIEDVLPAFLHILSGALGILNQACTDLQPIWQWFWENFLYPILSWTGGIIVDVLNGIGDALKWISNNEVAMSILEGIAIAIGLVATAIGIYNGVMAICNIVTGIFSGIMAILTSPITLVVLAIGALIAIIILCVKHWDDIKAAAVSVWEKIKEVWNTVASWFNNTVIKPVVNFFSGLWNGLKEGAKNAWEGIKSVFSTVASFFKSIFSKAWNAVKNVFSTGGKIFDGIKEGIVNAFKTVVNGIITGINKVVAVPFNGINTVLKKIKGISIAGMKPFDWMWTLTVPQIPKLATGAVIPPRQEFAAILGDQKHGTNIEAPLETIKQADREVMEEFMSKLLSLKQEEREIILKNWTFNLQCGNTQFGKIVLQALRLLEKEMGKPLLLS